MKKIALLTTAFAIFIGVQMIAPSKSEAQITCSTDIFGNTRCVDSNTCNYPDTKIDIFGNDTMKVLQVKM